MKGLSFSRFRRLLTEFIVIGLLAHIGLLIYLTFSSTYDPLGKSRPANFYQHAIHLGPFFRDETIKSSVHFSVGILNDSSWQYIDIIEKHFNEYQTHPWKTGELTIRDYIRDYARKLNRASGNKNSKAFKKLYSLTSREIENMNSSDSIRWIYTTRSYILETKQVRIDTLMKLQFTPADAADY